MTRRAKAVIYTKYCLSCEYPEEWQAILSWYSHEGIDIKVKRTAYRPDWHKKAVKIWGGEDYLAFIQIGKGKAKDIMIEANKCKNKLAQLGRTKDDMQRLSKAKGSDRKSRLADQGDEAPAEGA